MSRPNSASVGFPPNSASHGAVSTGRLHSRVTVRSDLSNESGIEEKVRNSVDRSRRAEAWEAKEQAQADEEHPDRVHEMLRFGVISEGDAGRLNSRYHMHERRTSEQAQNEGILAAIGIETTEAMLEDTLDPYKKSGVLRTMERSLGITRIRLAVTRERSRRNSPSFQHWCPCLRNTVASPWFEGFMGVLMICNGVLIGIQASLSQEDELAQLLELLEHFFTAVFLVEIGMRLLAYGWIWICDLLNITDFSLITFTGVLPMWILGPAGLKSEMIRVLQVLRVLRLVRLIRMFRFKKNLRVAHKLTEGLFSSGAILFHTYCVIGVALYVFSVFAVYLIGRSPLFKVNAEVDGLVQEFFKTVPAAIFSLFQTMTLDSWTGLVRPLMEYSALIWVFFTTVIMVMTLVLQNLITAVIVSHALGKMAEDDELIAQEKREEQKADFKVLHALFNELATGESGLLSQEDFANAVKNNKRLKNNLTNMDVNVAEAGEIWDLLDAPPEGIAKETFANGMRAMKGEALAKDSFSIVQRVRRINARISRLNVRLVDYKKQIDKLRTDSTIVRNELGGLLHEVHQFLNFASGCVSAQGISRTKQQLEADMETTYR